MNPWECPRCHGIVAPHVAVHYCDSDATAADESHESRTESQKTGASVADETVAHGLEVQELNPSPRASHQYTAQFEEFWSTYPRKTDKRKSFLAYRNATRRASHQDICDGAMRYASDPNRLSQFTKIAATWLNADGWLDEPLPARLGRGVEPAKKVPTPEDIHEEVRRYIGDKP